MTDINKFLLFLSVVLLALAIAWMAKDSSKNDAESMKGEPAARVATQNLGTGIGETRKMRRVKTQTSMLPASLYAGLNYGTPSLVRIPASQPMIDAFDGLFDNTKKQATMGEDAVFYLRQMPANDVVDEFNKMTLSAVKPEVRHQVVVIVQSTPAEIQGKYAVYAFLDKDVQWEKDMVDYCMDPSDCVKSDVYKHI